MVLADRHSEMMRNGRRSRGPSPNGHGGSPDSTSDEDNSIKRNGSKSKKQSEYEEKIRVGRDYQAVCPELVPAQERKLEMLNDRALLVWSPTKEIPDTKLEEYISVAKEKYGYNGEQALGMLFWHKHDLERAVLDLANFTPFPDEWTVEDKVLFEQAFQFHGKSFRRIRQMLPDKSIASLVKYYYSWKKTRHRQSVMDRQEKAKTKESSENGSENGSNEESDIEEKEQAPAQNSQDTQIKIGDKNMSHNLKKQSTTTPTPQQQQQLQQQTSNNSTSSTNNQTQSSSNNTNNSNMAETAPQTSVNNANTASGSLATAAASGSGSCTGCGVLCNIVNNTPHGKLCNSCYHHWRRTGTKRPTTGPYFGKRFRDRNAERHKRKPPRGMHINHDDIVALASSSNNQDELLANTDREIISLLSQVQLNKQQLSSLKRKNSDSSEELRPIDTNNRITSRWSNDEIMQAVHGVRKFGKDFQAIAEVLGNKTEAHIRTFFVNYRRRYNLDNVLKEFEIERDSVKIQDATPEIDSSKNEQSADPSVSNGQTENIVMEIDLDNEVSETPPVKKTTLISITTPSEIEASDAMKPSTCI